MGTGHSWEQFSSLSNRQLTKTFGHCSTKTMHQLSSHSGNVEQLGHMGTPSPPKLNNFAFKPRLCFGWAPTALALKTHLCTSRTIWRCLSCLKFLCDPCPRVVGIPWPLPEGLAWGYPPPA